MTAHIPPFDLPLGELLESLLPDFILAFTFFTALIYAALNRRFEHQRPVIAMSAAIGMALSVGLTWWEYDNGYSIRNLGPIAVGFAVIMLGAVMYQAIRHVGGSWAGIGIALGTSLIIAWILGLEWPLRAEIIQTVTTVALLVGILAFVIHYASHPKSWHRPSLEPAEVRHDMADLYRDRHLGKQLGKQLKQARQEAGNLHEHPKDAQNIMLQLKRMLPAEGWLTQRLAQLRAKAHRLRNGHVARIDEIRHVISKLPVEAKKKASQELIARYRQLQLDRRMERLDNAVAANEKRIRELTQLAQQCLARHDHQRLHDILKDAQKLQKHNSRLFKLIESTEKRLATIANQAVRQQTEVSDA